MNTKLQKLFHQYDLSEKDRSDFLQIYNLLPWHKKIRAVERFEEIINQIDSLREDLYVEHEILFGSTLNRIETKLKKIQEEVRKNKSSWEVITSS